MIKTYKLTQPLRNSSFVLRGKTGNPTRYNFSGGDPLTGKAATLKPFKQGYVKLVRTDNGGENVPTPEVQKTVVDGVTSPEQLIEYVATNLEKVYQRPDAALNYARSKGFEFPNLELKKPE